MLFVESHGVRGIRCEVLLRFGSQAVCVPFSVVFVHGNCNSSKIGGKANSCCTSLSLPCPKRQYPKLFFWPLGLAVFVLDYLLKKGGRVTTEIIKLLRDHHISGVFFCANVARYGPSWNLGPSDVVDIVSCGWKVFGSPHGPEMGCCYIEREGRVMRMGRAAFSRQDEGIVCS